MEDNIETKIKCPECGTTLDAKDIYNAILNKINKYIKSMHKGSNNLSEQ